MILILFYIILSYINKMAPSGNLITVSPTSIRNELEHVEKCSKCDRTQFNRSRLFVELVLLQLDLCNCLCCDCSCYNEKSSDARCCGACYVCCPTKNKEEQYLLCPNDFTAYWGSGYVQTVIGNHADDEENNRICSLICLPLKCSLFVLYLMVVSIIFEKPI